jgi:hypothetical protein
MSDITVVENLAPEPIVETEAVKVAPAEEAVALPETEAVETEGEGEAETEEQARDEKGRFKGDGVQRRIDELTRARREAERKAEYWQGIATQTAPDAPAERPTRDQFADQDDYVEALAEWKAEQAVARVQQQSAAQAADNARQSAWEAREAEAKAVIPDYDAVVPQSTVPVKPHVVDALMDSDAGPALVYHLAKNPDVAARLNAMTPTRAAIELGRLETTLTAPAVKVPSNAPTPITPITPQASGRNIDLSKATMDDYIAERKRQGATFR